MTEETEIKDEGVSPNVNLDIDKQENVEFQKYSTSILGLNYEFYQTLCGWVVKKDSRTESTAIGIDSIIPEVHYTIDSSSRFCNEKCANVCCKAIYPLISHTAQYSNLTDLETYDEWNGLGDGLRFSLLKNYYLNNNTFQLKREHLTFIIAYVMGYSAYTRKARGGFMTKQTTETTMSVYNTLARQGMIPENKGIIDKLLSWNKKGG